MRKHLVVASVTVGLLVLGATAASAADFTKKKACVLVTDSDVEEAFGAAPNPGVDQTEKGKFTTCTWTIPATGGTTTAFIGIDKTNKLNKKDFAEKRKGDTAEKVAGIKKGFYHVADGAGTVTFIKGDNFVNVQYLGISGSDPAASKDALIAFAKEAYKSLKA